MLSSSGLRLSLAGVLMFVLGILSLFVLPHGFAIVTILAGGLCVWAGFIWTIFGYYTANAQPPHDT